MMLYEVGCIVKEVQPKNGVKISLEEAQALVDGYVELIHLDGDNILLCDGDGVLRFKRINTLATSHAKQLGWKGSYLVGSVLFLKDKEFCHIRIFYRIMEKSDTNLFGAITHFSYMDGVQYHRKSNLINLSLVRLTSNAEAQLYHFRIFHILLSLLTHLVQEHLVHRCSH